MPSRNRPAAMTLLGLLLGLLVPVAQAEQDFYITTSGSYVLGTDRLPNGLVPRVTYLPGGSPIFPRSEAPETPFRNEHERYWRAMTAYGQEVFVLAEAVRRIALEDHDDYIVHSRFCPDDDARPPLECLSALELLHEARNEGQDITLSRERKLFPPVRMTHAEFARARYQGAVSPLYRQPAIDAEASAIPELALACGERHQAGDRLSPDTAVATTVVGGFDDYRVANDTIHVDETVGGAGESVAYRHYDVRLTDHAPERATWLTRVTYECRDGRRTRITEVAMRNPEEDIDFAMLPRPGALDQHPITQYTNAPYLFSINDPQSFHNLLRQLSERFSSPELAAYFIAEFNRSCRGRYRHDDHDCVRLFRYE